ncbi:type VI secretion system protein TssL, long form [Thermochromatium tepidum]|uniref:Type VI secretion system protein TssL n=1 Tax=Thermochromatium tepidum ATCC 43061 TaxID=316276 RepID=A0A6I6E9W7_THETI|nr:type VI secretion system protein TssL, long form [Thermochromatium tepidum]QGU33378.1 type VI secretion system protein TssL [Thermochromatium tepidum ATCC 43061]
MVEECECPDPPPAGAPEWMATFADLMSLMMCFFVLLLSFSEMDVIKYKQVAGSLKAAFGVQRDIEAQQDPLGTSIIMQEFSPAQPQPTVVTEVRQQTTDETKRLLEILDPAVEDAQDKAEDLKHELKLEIEKGLIEINTIDDQVVIRILEKGSFPSASARISPDFKAMLMKIADALNQIEGRILIAGHTDNVPIETAEFPSNWVLSAARAAAVAHTMTQKGGIAPERVEIRAYGENRPIDSNDTLEGRAHNRRVEIVVLGDRSAQTLLENIDGDNNPQAKKGL